MSCPMTKEQRDNLEKLASYLATGHTRMKFNMGYLCVDKDDRGILAIPPQEHACGTIGCALGHGPAAGIAPLPGDEGWGGYSARAFGLRAWSKDWQWCFSCDWQIVDPTPQGAAKRIRHLLEHGIPPRLPASGEE